LDKGYKAWEIVHNVSSKLIIIFGAIFNYNIYRLYYSRYLGFDFLCVKFNNFS